MSATLIPSARLVPPQMRHAPLSSNNSLSSNTRFTSAAIHSDDPFVDYQPSPFPSQDARSNESPDSAETGLNPVPELISDEVFQVLRANDLINEKGIRDHIIRRAFKSMRDEQALKSSEALAKLQAIYPYLQIDTIRKIIYRIGPGCHRKAMI
ncbi:MAG TPA: hypothetical protein VGM92_14440 [Candidatus Kapabacteria bacterium]|jgi:hypothetical protein